MSEQHANGELRIRIIGELAKSDVCVHLAELARAIEVKQDMVSVVLRRLETQGMVQRVERGCWEPTEAGREYVERIRAFVT